MTRPIAPLASAIALTLTVACAPALDPRSTYAVRPLTTSSPAMTADRLSKLEGLTALQALRTMPSYSAAANQSPPPRFTLVLDGMRIADLDFLKSICATDVYEIQVRRASENAYGFGGPEVIVTTMAGRRRTR